MNSAVPMHSRAEWPLLNLLKVLEVISKQSPLREGWFSGERARGTRREKKTVPSGNEKP